jgi:outer membrane protein TolC
MDFQVSRRALLAPALIFSAALQSGLCACTGFSQDGGFSTVAASTTSRLAKTVSWPRSDAEAAKSSAAVTQLMSRPLAPDDAVQVALLNNRGLRASFQDLQISEADLVQAGRLPNPRWDFSHAGGGGQVDVVETLSFNVLSLLTLPYAHEIEKQSFARMQTTVFLGVAQLAARTREAYFDAVAAHQSLEYRRQVSDAAETGAVLAQRMQAAGNWNDIDQAREQVFYADATRDLTRAEAADVATREKLQSLLGISGDADSAPTLELAPALPDLPAGIEALPDVERTVLQNRIDLQMMHQNIEALARRLKLVRATRFVNVLDLGPSWVQQGPRDAPHERGYAITLEVPIFDDGAARLKKSEALYIQAVERFAQAAIEAREQISSIDDYIIALRDFWLAKSRLDAALLGTPTF